MALAGWARATTLSPSGKARQNMNLSVDGQRFGARRTLLNDVDSINRQVDRSGQMEGLDGFEQQAFDLAAAPRTCEEGRSQGTRALRQRPRRTAAVGQAPLRCRRRVEVSYCTAASKARSQQLDQGVSALINDLTETGQLEDTLVVVTGEFGRTPVSTANRPRPLGPPLHTGHGRRRIAHGPGDWRKLAQG